MVFRLTKSQQTKTPIIKPILKLHLCGYNDVNTKYNVYLYLYGLVEPPIARVSPSPSPMQHLVSGSCPGVWGAGVWWVQAQNHDTALDRLQAGLADWIWNRNIGIGVWFEK